MPRKNFLKSWKDSFKRGRLHQHQDSPFGNEGPLATASTAIASTVITSTAIASTAILSTADSFHGIHESEKKTDKGYNPPNIWQAAYDQLNEEQKRNLMTNNSTSDRSGNDEATPDIESALNTVIDTVKKQHEIRKLKNQDSWLGDGPQKILGVVLSLKENISAVIACDPTGHASSAWAVVSLGLTITQNYRKQQDAWFESSKFLSDTISRLTLIEIRYREGNPTTKEGVESTLTQVYLEILRYAAEVVSIQRSNKGVQILKSITAMTDLPLENIKKSIQSEELELDKWIKIQQDIDWTEKAHKILAQSSEILSVVHKMDENAELSKLPMVNRAIFGSYTSDIQDECLTNTRVELLQIIADWIDDPHGKAVFWLNGLAGTGKSTIARTVARLMQERGLLGASFFFNRSENDRANLSKFISTIVRQLMDILPDLKKDIIMATKFASSEIPVQFEELLTKPLSEFKTSTGQKLLLVIIIDALDECDDENIPALIHLLSQLQRTSPSIELRVFVTSRPELPIRLGFKKVADEHQKATLHEIDDSIIKNDLLLFFKDKLAKIRNLREEGLNEDWPGEHKIQTLVTMSTPLFIFAATMCRALKDPQWPVEDILNGILEYRDETSKLSGTYLPILNNLLRGQTERRKVELVQQIKDVVGAIIILEDTLSMKSLAKLIDVPEQIVRTRVKSIPSVLQIPKQEDEPVRLFHKSFRDFLLDSQTNKSEFRVDGIEIHTKMAFNCIGVLEREEGGLRKNICRLDSYGFARKEIDNDRIKNHLPRELQYACRHWVQHLQQAKFSISDQDKIHLFLEAHFLHWLEAMSILGYLSELVNTIDVLKSLVQTQVQSSVMKFLYDAKRFLLKNMAIAEEAPLQIYSSGLLFAPERCTIRNTFQRIRPQYFSQLPIVDLDWGPALQTIEEKASNFRSLAFSPDSKLIASIIKIGINLLNTATGTLQQTLEHDEAYSVTFSPNGKLIASGCQQGTVKLWDMASGLAILRQTFQAHGDAVQTVAFSHNSEQLASTASGKAIKLWNINPLSLQQTIEGHSRTVFSVAFSLDGRFLASASDDRTVRLWNVTPKSVKLQHVFREHYSSVSCVAFSRDSHFLVSGSNDRSVKLWDIALGGLKHSFIGHSEGVSSVAYSPNGQFIASGSLDGTIKLWDIASGTEKCTLEPHSNGILSVSFSPNGALLASGSTGGTMRLWDVNLCMSHENTGNHTDRIKRVLFSPNQILSASVTEHGITIWDSSSGKRLHLLDAHPSSLNILSSVVFSHDSQIIASSSHDYILRLWETASGKLVKVIEGHEDDLIALAFSSDRTLIASGSWDKTIRLWDIESGKALQTIDSTQILSSLAFSHDNKQLAACFYDYTVRVWDTASGTLLVTLRGGSRGVSLISVAFSPNGKLLAASCLSGYLMLWDTASGVLTGTFPVNEDLDLVSFSEDGTLLNTNWGSYCIKNDGNSTSLSKNAPHVEIGNSGWIQYEQARILWLPPEYRTKFSTYRDNLLLLGHDYGQVSFIRFNGLAGDDPSLRPV